MPISPAPISMLAIPTPFHLPALLHAHRVEGLAFAGEAEFGSLAVGDGERHHEAGHALGLEHVVALVEQAPGFGCCPSGRDAS